MPEARINAAITNGERLEALYSLELLDTRPEEVFDQITRLAAKLVDAPVARVDLADRDRLFVRGSASAKSILVLRQHPPLPNGGRPDRGRLRRVEADPLSPWTASRGSHKG